ncbi:hypothetical protein DO97_17515 [Neosynechococcus sphagnicola sy1]|uniref:SCP domain-containing protein n=1 Tax=Neosynechococcus sphagnicola sy1 TaxID=1497020 RepID=A0A098THL8_9CYAN|nr:CAP domain-containing protein [Neosynechococcus sphagnicola]KGF71564.1 hypothetical protein DO97_17515 [Neosynechococcus sphagnicola sy1]
MIDCLFWIVVALMVIATAVILGLLFQVISKQRKGKFLPLRLKRLLATNGYRRIVVPALIVIPMLLSAMPTRFQYRSSETSAQKAFEYVNQLRQRYGRSAIAWDERVYELAMARAKDMMAQGYYDHTNPFTGECPDKMRPQFGLSANEYVAENIDGYAEQVLFSWAKIRPVEDAVRDWMTSRGHRYNLLYKEHTAGAIACYKDKCVFLGLNQNQFGKGCYKMADTKKIWKTAPPKPEEVTIDERDFRRTVPTPSIKLH